MTKAKETPARKRAPTRGTLALRPTRALLARLTEVAGGVSIASRHAVALRALELGIEAIARDRALLVRDV